MSVNRTEPDNGLTCAKCKHLAHPGKVCSIVTLATMKPVYSSRKGSVSYGGGVAECGCRG